MNKSLVTFATDSGVTGSTLSKAAEVWIGMAERGAPPPDLESDGFR